MTKQKHALSDVVEPSDLEEMTPEEIAEWDAEEAAFMKRHPGMLEYDLDRHLDSPIGPG